MSLKSDDLENAAATAASAVALARLQLQKLQEGATDTDLSRADEARRDGAGGADKGAERPYGRARPGDGS